MLIHIRIRDKKLDLDPDPLPRWILNSGALEAQNEAVEGRGRSNWSPGGPVDHWSRMDSYHFVEKQDPDPH